MRGLIFKNMDTYIVKAGVMAWPKVKSVLIHAFLLGLGYIAMTIEQNVSGGNFGAYSPIIMGVNSIVFKFIQKWFTDHGVVVS